MGRAFAVASLSALAIAVAPPAAEPARAQVSPQNPLALLEAAGSEVSIADVEALLQRAYDELITSSERARAFAAAAEFASESGAHEQALAWTDWALEEAGRLRVERSATLEPMLAAAVARAVRAERPLRARAYARWYAELELGWADDPGGNRVALSLLDAQCPDVIDDGFVRLQVTFGAATAGDPRARSMRCAYMSFERGGREDRRLEIEVFAKRSWTPAAEQIRGVVETGLDPEDAARRLAIAQSLPVMLALEERDPSVAVSGEAGYARYSRPGVNDVAADAYVLDQRAGSLVAARVSANDRAWPPAELAAIADIVLSAARPRSDDSQRH